MFDISIILLLIFQGAIKQIFNLFDYFDEFVLVIYSLRFFIQVILKRKKIKLFRYEKITIILLCIFYIIGIISSYYYKVQGYNMSYIISGLLSIKPIIIYFIARVVMKGIKIERKKLNKIYNLLLMCLWIYFGILIVNIPFGFLKNFDERYGIKTVSIGFEHVSELDFFIISIMIILLFLTYILKKSYKKYLINLIPSFFLVLFSGRTKALAFLVVYFLILIIIFNFGKLKKRYFIAMIPMIIFIGMDRLKISLFSLEAARGALYSTSIKIAMDFFPLGSGFGTFGTAYSAKNYSPLYFYYGINNVWGLSSNMSSFITDTHWPPILAETGLFGALIYISIIFCLFKLFWKIDNNIIMRVSIISLFTFGIISSVAEPFFMSYKGVGMFIITAFFISVNKSYKHEN